jgi:hypothetical protein
MANIEVNPNDRKVDFTVTLTNATDRDFHWKLEGEGFTPACVIGEKAEGIDKIGSSKVIPITLKDNRAIRNLKNFRMIIRENGPNGAIVATSALVTVVVTIPTKPPVDIGIIPISVPFNSDGRPSWQIDQGNYPDAVDQTNRIELRASLEQWGFEVGGRWFEVDGYSDPGEAGTWGPYHVISYDSDTDTMTYERSYFSATGDMINSVWKTDGATECIEKAMVSNDPERKSCVMPFVLNKEIWKDGEHVGDRDFSKLDLVAELRVMGYEEYTKTWYNDPVYGHRAYSGPQGNTMIDCPLYKNVTPMPSAPLVSEFRPTNTSVEKCHVEYFASEGRGYVQIPLHQMAHYEYDVMNERFVVNKLRPGYNARMKLTIKERTTGEVVSGLMFSVMQNDIHTDNVSFMTDRWARQNLKGVIGEVSRVTEISPLYWAEPQRWVACDYTPEPDGTNIIIVGLNLNDTPDEYLENPTVPAPKIPYFTTPYVDNYPVGMTVKGLNIAEDPVGAILHLLIRPFQLGDQMYPDSNFWDPQWQIWEGPESYLDIFAATGNSVAAWKSKRRKPAGAAEFSLDTTNILGELTLRCNIAPTVMDKVHKNIIVIDFRNGYWAAIDCDVTLLPSGWRIRAVGSTVTDIDLN